MAHKQLNSELYWLKANSFKLTFDIIKALHILSEHPTAITLQENVESPILTDFAVQQSCETCLRNQTRKKLQGLKIAIATKEIFIITKWKVLALFFFPERVLLNIFFMHSFKVLLR